ncbi:Hypothetical protein A7982_02360 [Minicystis rosea]|nr:Hypothetical protein A7982_02360 [Minicystis rosea]
MIHAGVGRAPPLVAAALLPRVAETLVLADRAFDAGPLRARGRRARARHLGLPCAHRAAALQDVPGALGHVLAAHARADVIDAGLLRAVGVGVAARST